jgi:glucosamine--fructose-6-phosphate aminotransferase (isomerizing)
MCGIFGYVGEGNKKKCKEIIIQGLSRLEYRGYDSAGFVCVDQEHKHLSFAKSVGSVSQLKKLIEPDKSDGFVGMGHTRWATHGKASETNAHPQFDCTHSIAVVHNGIIENHNEIRKKLFESDHEFSSKTDTEVIPHLLESMLQQNALYSVHEALKYSIINLTTELKGIYALVFLLEKYPDQLLLVRHKSPLSVGIGDNAMFVASDPISFADSTNKVLFMPDKSFAFLKANSIELYNFEGKALRVKTQSIDIKFTAANKQGFDHYMLKEIYEQKKAIDNTISFYKLIGNQIKIESNYRLETDYGQAIWSQLGICKKAVKKLKKIIMIAAGTSWHAGRIAQFYFETICNIPTEVQLASEFRYKKFFPEENSIVIAISQSGETADTLECLRHIHNYNIPTIAITNVASSTMVREAGGFLLMQAGPEISVASTKAFTSQLASLYWLANRMALSREEITAETMKLSEDDLFVAAEILESSIENYKWEIKEKLAKKYSKYKQFIFLGRNLSYPFAMEAALKLKEISYIFSQAYPAGELKHGPIALIDNKTPVMVFSSLDELIYQKLLGNVQEIKARNGHVVAFAFEGQQELIDLADTTFIFPEVGKLLEPIAMSGVMQFFVYNISKELGLPIDKPRNLAKSVTVE